MVEIGRKSIVVKDLETVEELEKIRQRLGLKAMSEVVRYLVRYYEERELQEVKTDA